jgi:hypothetical protein
MTLAELRKAFSLTPGHAGQEPQRQAGRDGAYQQSCPLVVLLPALPRSYSMMRVIVLEFGN